MRPWQVSVGMTMVAFGVGTWLLLEELSYLQPFVMVVATDYGVVLGAYGALALVTVSGAAYVAARSLGLGDVGRKVSVMERSIRRGEGQDPELAAALQREAAGEYDE